VLFPQDDLDEIEIMRRVMKHWHAFLLAPLASTLLFVGIWLFVPPVYKASTSFVPETGSQRRLTGTLAGLAGQLGLPIVADAAQTPRFYSEVIGSRSLRERMLTTYFKAPIRHTTAPDSEPLIQILGVRGDDRADSLENGLKKLNTTISVQVDNQTRIIRLTAETRSAQLSADVANRFVDYLNDFNAQTRQSQARERRKFVEERVQDAQRNLTDAEERLKGFYEANRSWQQSPQLVFEEGRLRRQVEMGQELYLSLRREYETARIEEVNDTPVLTVLDKAVPPRRQSWPRLNVSIAFGLSFGILLAVAWSLFADNLRRVYKTVVSN